MKINPKNILKSAGGKLLKPWRYRRHMQMARAQQAVTSVHLNPQLQLYSKMLPGDFLHYGYFDEVDIPPERISLHDLYQAQYRYAELLIEQASNQGTVLDAGCGLGGLIQVLLDRGFDPVALTPDRFQIEYLKEKYPSTSLMHAKFEDLPVQEYDQHFDTVIHSESIQYMRLNEVIPIMQRILKPEGRWVICDYFRIGEACEKSGYEWDVFREQLQEHGFEIIYERDITAHVQPTLAYIHMWGERIAVPVVEYLCQKLEKKKPGLFYLLEESIEACHLALDKQLDIVDPEVFGTNKRYMLMTVGKVK